MDIETRIMVADCLPLGAMSAQPWVNVDHTPSRALKTRQKIVNQQKLKLATDYNNIGQKIYGFGVEDRLWTRGRPPSIFLF